MHSSNTKVPQLSAEARFRAAFDRLKANTPERVRKNCIVSQNNVAREAGLDPSALRKSRFPTLVAQIQSYVSENAKVVRLELENSNERRTRNRNLRERLLHSQLQRDKLANLLNSANKKILELTARVAELEAKLPASNVIRLSKSHTEN